VFDGTFIGNPLRQATGLAQCDNIASIVLVALVARLLERLAETFPDIKITGYADDDAADDIELLKNAFSLFEDLCKEFKLTISPHEVDEVCERR
jgi:hypothetical protein